MIEYDEKLLDKVIHSFNLDLRDCGNRYTGRCPIHEGDNKGAFSIYKETGVWMCFSRGCHSEYPAGIFGLVKALIKKENPRITNQQIIDAFNMNIDTSLSSSINGTYLETLDEKATKISRESVRERLQFPAKYFIDRGINEEILDKYDVGVCQQNGKPMSQRCVIPIYDRFHNNIIGFSGRSLDDQLKPKWLHTKFEKKKVLYNIWFANSFIKLSKVAIITEGPVDVWKLEQAGIPYGLGVLGVHLTPQQLKILSSTGANTVVLVLDNDKAGIEATKKLASQLNSLYNVVIPSIEPYNDLGDMPENQINKILSPIIEKYRHD